MAVKLIAQYQKRAGLPSYSSHSFSISVEIELRDLDDLRGEATRLYGLLQSNVDEQIQATGFVPDHDYGMADSPAASNGSNGTNASNGHSQNGSDRWRCSDKQRELILKLVDEHSLDKDEVDHLARQRFGKGVKQLNRMESSGLIEELLETHGGGSKCNGSNGTRRNAYARNGGGGR